MGPRAAVISVALNISLLFLLVAVFLTQNNLIQPEAVSFWLLVLTMVVIFSFGSWHRVYFQSAAMQTKLLIHQLQLLKDKTCILEHQPKTFDCAVQSLSEVFSSCHSSCPLHQSILDQIPTAEQYSVLRDICEECGYLLLNTYRYLWRRGPHTIICSFYSFSRFLLGGR